MMKLSAWIECLYLDFLIKSAERDIKSIERSRELARRQIVVDTETVESYERHVVTLVQRLGKARSK